MKEIKKINSFSKKKKLQYFHFKTIKLIIKQIILKIKENEEN